jgi:hypothetical protein
MRRIMNKQLAIAALLLFSIATTVSATEPTNPSQIDVKRIVMLTPNVGEDDNGPCGLTSLRVDGIINTADGTVSPFALKPGEVFVLTSGTWRDQGRTPGSSSTLEVSVFTATGTTGAIIVLGPGSLADTGGFVSGSFQLQPGIVIKRGASICVSIRNQGIDLTNVARLYGYIAKTK